ncbi:MAE_28990/MAE_18760 family HEPN-like nuclease [Amycolatopsis lurida]|uniref:MAE_28990/MAE_18760 family HEPN-like nuclease n=1 Tax=Amycolatopsis lurida TaxID=31959 RepID=UPI001300CDB1|nr:MAE_28990/MAE_18760 family HEPN-like nuclease [Amycolatopsis lurida]
MANNVDCNPLRDTFRDRIAAARRLVDATKLQQAPLGSSAPTDVSREARGLAVLLLFAAYENLLKNLCRSLLENISKSRAHASSLKPALRLFLAHSELTSVSAGGQNKLWKSAGLEVIRAIAKRPASEIDVDLFPDDGSYMKSSQVKLFCEVFDFGDPGPILRGAWHRLNTIVDQRNSIAHGSRAPEEVGRGYSHNDILNLINIWETSWMDFLTWVESSCKGKKFYLEK